MNFECTEIRKPFMSHYITLYQGSHIRGNGNTREVRGLNTATTPDEGAL